MDWKNQILNITNKVKLQLFSSKQDDLEALYNQQAILDPQNQGILDQDQFEKLLQKLGIFLTTQEIRCVYEQFKRNGNIYYQEFFNCIRQNISQKRVQAIQDAFKYICPDDCKISIDAIVQKYLPNDHFRVKTNEKSVQQIRNQFMIAIKRKSQDGICITDQDFYEYYLDVNATLPNEKEDFFLNILAKTWGITCGSDYISPEHLENLQKTFFDKIRSRTLPNQDEGQTLSKIFNYYDVTDFGYTDFDEFIQVLKSIGCNFNQNEYRELFHKYCPRGQDKFNFHDLSVTVLQYFSGKVQNHNTLWKITQDPPREIIDQIKQALMKSNKDLLQIFEQHDINKNEFINRQQLQQCLKEAGVNLSHVQINKLAQYFDANQQEKIFYHQFMNTIQ